MGNLLGERIATLRREKGMTQDAVAERLGVSGQAVSKWENGISYPDITILPEIAKLFGVTVDELLSGKKKAEAIILSPEQRKSIDEMMLIVKVNSHNGDKVRVNLPLALAKVGYDIGANLPQVAQELPWMKDIDFSQILLMAEKGMLGKLVEVESHNGDTVNVYVE